MNTKKICHENYKRKETEGSFPVWLAYRSVIDAFRVHAITRGKFLLINGRRYNAYRYEEKTPKGTILAQVPTEVAERLGLWYASDEVSHEGASTDEDVMCVQCVLKPLISDEAWAWIPIIFWGLVILVVAVLGFVLEW